MFSFLPLFYLVLSLEKTNKKLSPGKAEYIITYMSSHESHGGGADYLEESRKAVKPIGDLASDVISIAPVLPVAILFAFLPGVPYKPQSGRIESAGGHH